MCRFLLKNIGGLIFLLISKWQLIGCGPRLRERARTRGEDPGTSVGNLAASVRADGRDGQPSSFRCRSYSQIAQCEDELPPTRCAALKPVCFAFPSFQLKCNHPCPVGSFCGPCRHEKWPHRSKCRAGPEGTMHT